MIRKAIFRLRLCNGSTQTFHISEITKCNTSSKVAYCSATDTFVLHGLECILHYRIKTKHSHCKIPLKNSFDCLPFFALVLFWHSMKQLQLFFHVQVLGISGFRLSCLNWNPSVLLQRDLSLEVLKSF